MTTRADLVVNLETQQTELTAAQSLLSLRQSRVNVATTKLARATAAGNQSEIDLWTQRLTNRTSQFTEAQTSFATETSDVGFAGQRISFYDTVTTLLPYLPPELAILYADKWIDSDDRELAMAAVTTSPTLETYFPGLRRPNGTLRTTIPEYLGTMAAYEQVILSAGVNPSFFASQMIAAFTGEVSPGELASRIAAIEEDVISKEQEIQEMYSTFYGVAMTREALIASAMDPAISKGILERRIAIAEVGGAAALSRFAITQNTATALYNTGVRRAQAQELFRAAGEILPDLSQAGFRQGEGEIGIEDFVSAEGLGDVAQRQRLRRTLAGEQANFSERGGFAADERTGAVTGLRVR
jgi:hypothetical protein